MQYFAGDDTWMQLFPSTFHTSHPFPSLVVNDLDTVDTGVWEHILAAIRGFHVDWDTKDGMPKQGNATDPWDIFVGHNLGVDHAGHTYGVNSKRMEAKLTSIDHQMSALTGVQPAPRLPCCLEFLCLHALAERRLCYLHTLPSFLLLQGIPPFWKRHLCSLPALVDCRVRRCPAVQTRC